MAEKVLSKLRGTCKVYLCNAENSSKEVNILETFLPVSNFDTIIRLNTLKALVLNKMNKIKGLNEQLLLQLNEKDLEKELDQILTNEDKYLLYLKWIYICQRRSKNTELNIFAQDLSFQISERAQVCLPN